MLQELPELLCSGTPPLLKLSFWMSLNKGLHLSIRCLVSQHPFFATFVYGFNTITARRHLWDNLRQWAPVQPWIIMGDFNSILSQHDNVMVNQLLHMRSVISVSVAMILA